MKPYERVHNAIEFKPVDKVPLEYHASTVGLYEHGDKLRELFRSVEGDFEDYTGVAAPAPDPRHFDKDGRYHAFIKDEWGVEWEERIFGVYGLPFACPLDDFNNIHTYRMPPPAFAGENLENTVARVAAVRKTGRFSRLGWASLFERMHFIRGFENTLIDLVEQPPELGMLAGIFDGYWEREIAALIEAKVDCVTFGDDFGMQKNLIFSPEIFRSFFKPRYQRLMKPIKEAGIKIHFHSCGDVWDLLEDFKDMGVDSIWPQITAYDLKEFVKKLRDLELAAAIHIDRANVMTSGTPDEVRRSLNACAEAFRPYEGGSWFYVEIDNGFPYENIVALVDEINKYR